MSSTKKTARNLIPWNFFSGLVCPILLPIGGFGWLYIYGLFTKFLNKKKKFMRSAIFAIKEKVKKEKGWFYLTL